MVILRPDGPLPTTFDDVPIRVLLPAYILSELKTAFLMGFQIYLPFLIVDLVVASVTISMGDADVAASGDLVAV